jgi:hypothetical protein
MAPHYGGSGRHPDPVALAATNRTIAPERANDGKATW